MSYDIGKLKDNRRIMVKTLIIYKSYLGSVEKYARWLGCEVDADLIKFKEFKKKTLSGYDAVVVSSGTYAGYMPLVRFLKRNWNSFDGMKVIVMAVGAAPADDPWSERSYNKIPDFIKNNIKYFKLPGKMDENTSANVKKSNLKPVVEYLRALK